LTDNLFLNYTPALSVALSATEGVVGSIIITLIAKGKFLIRDLVISTSCGAIAGGASSYFTDSVAYALGIGLASGILQSTIHHAF
jgi:hypothetical protein